VTDFAYLESPIGLIEIGGTVDAITALQFVEARREGASSNPLIDAAARQVGEYFAGTRRAFDLPLDLGGTPFQRAVWARLLEIPYGEMTTYQTIAAVLGRPRAVRAVGAAIGQNPVSILVPCHRVVGSNGSLTGYAGGLWRKERLLRHEGALLV
jgi:methylated-DNA-[protein]-cysteine S-methyltransferase